MVVLLKFFWDGEYGFNTELSTIQEQDYVALPQGSEMTAGFHCRN